MISCAPRWRAVPDARDPKPIALAVAFARVLRGAGLDVPVGATLLFAQALACVGLDGATASTGRAGRRS